MCALSNSKEDSHTKLALFCCKNFFVIAKRCWKASFTDIYLIEMYSFWFEENWVHLVVKRGFGTIHRSTIHRGSIDRKASLPTI
jgi:hypothetical protein